MSEVMVAGRAPARSLEQRMEALLKANEVRSYRAVLKRDLKAGRVSLLDVIAAPPEEVDTAKVLDLLMASPKIGRVKAMKLLGQVKASPSKTVGGLSRRQRVELADRLAERYGL